MKTLVVFYSRSGNTKKIAQILAKKLNADLDEIIDHTNRSGLKGWLLGGRDAMKKSLTEISVQKNPQNYDLVVIGTPIWVGASTHAFRTYLTQFKKDLKTAAIFTTSGSDGPEKTVAVFENITGQKCIASLGLTSAELSQNYDSKIDEFVKKIK
jgi:flavodoxin